MKKVILILICLIGLSVSAQTQNELLGKWQLVKWTKKGKTQDIKEYYKTNQVFQIFKEDAELETRIVNEAQSGKWELSKNNSELTVVGPKLSITYSIDYFDSEKLVITTPEIGTLEYKRVRPE